MRAGRFGRLAEPKRRADLIFALRNYTLFLLPLAARGNRGNRGLSPIQSERGELAEALVAGREGLPLRHESGHAWVAMDTLALRAGLAGKLDNAARIAGYADAVHAAKQSLRQPNEARAHARLIAVLRERLDHDRLAQLMASGAALSDDEACAIALED